MARSHREPPMLVSTAPQRMAPVADRCVCLRQVVLARTTDGVDVILDAGPDGRPAVFARGTFLEDASTVDIFGRRPLTVHPVESGGQFRRHACTGPVPRGDR